MQRLKIHKTGSLWVVDGRVRFSMLGGDWDWYPFAWLPTFRAALAWANVHGIDCVYCVAGDTHPDIPGCV